MSSFPSIDEQDASSRAVEDHCRAFIAKLDSMLASKDYTEYPMRKYLYNKKVECICLYKDNHSVSYKQEYQWVKEYDLHNIGGFETLVYKETPGTNGRLPDLDTYKTVSYIKTCFNEI